MDVSRELNKDCRKKRYLETWKDDERKRQRSSGERYVNRKGAEVTAKIFIKIDTCCKKQCYNQFNEATQLYLFTDFY